MPGFNLDVNDQRQKDIQFKNPGTKNSKFDPVAVVAGTVWEVWERWDCGVT